MKITECPRDAMQGIHEFIPTEKKVAYINSLLKVGFDTLDFGSFVSPKTIPQMREGAKIFLPLQVPNHLHLLLANYVPILIALPLCYFQFFFQLFQFN